MGLPHRLRAVVPAQVAVALLSAAVVVLEVALTRIFSFTLGYHYVFALVGLAVFGLGVGAAAAHVLGGAGAAYPKSDPTPLLAAGAGLAAIFSVLLAAPMAASGAPLLYILVGGLPFLPAGAALALLFTQHAEHSGRLYMADMAAAALAALLAVLALALWGALAATLLAGVLFATAGLVLILLGGMRRSPLVFVATAVSVAALFTQLGLGIVEMPAWAAGPEKSMAVFLRDDRSEARVDWSRWDAFARTDVVSSAGLPEEKVVFIDGGAGSLMLRFDEDIEELAGLRALPGYYPFVVREPGKVLAIGPGGGLDVLLALLAGADDITAVEVNPGTVAAMRAHAGFNGNLYDRPEVKVVVDEGRSYLRRSDERYDTMYLSLVMAQAAERPGLALSENYIYTVEAIQDYLSYLRPDGKVAFKLHDVVDLGRAFATAIAALEQRGMSPAQAAEQIVLYHDPREDTGHSNHGLVSPVMMVFATPLTPEEGDRIALDLRTRGLEPLLVPKAVAVEPYDRIADGNSSLPQFTSRWYANITPTYDDRPFFFEVDRGPSPQIIAMGLLVLVVGAAGWRAFFASSTLVGGESRYLAAYFGVLGAGFILVETASVQRLTLFLGHPTLAVATSLGGLLLAAGCGGLAAQRLPQLRLPQAMALAPAGVGLAVLGWSYLSPAITSAFLATDLTTREVIAWAMLAPLGFVLGISFPTGLRLAASYPYRAAIPIFWAVNGFGALAGSTVGMAVAQAFGFTAVLVSAAGLYLVLATATRFSALWRGTDGVLVARLALSIGEPSDSSPQIRGAMGSAGPSPICPPKPES